MDEIIDVEKNIEKNWKFKTKNHNKISPWTHGVFQGFSIFTVAPQLRAPEYDVFILQIFPRVV